MTFSDDSAGGNLMTTPPPEVMPSPPPIVPPVVDYRDYGILRNNDFPNMATEMTLNWDSWMDNLPPVMKRPVEDQLSRSMDKEATKRRIVDTSFLSERTGYPTKWVHENYDAVKAAFSQGVGRGAELLDDRKLHEFVKAESEADMKDHNLLFPSRADTEEGRTLAKKSAVNYAYEAGILNATMDTSTGRTKDLFDAFTHWQDMSKKDWRKGKTWEQYFSVFKKSYDQAVKDERTADEVFSKVGPMIKSPSGAAGYDLGSEGKFDQAAEIIGALPQHIQARVMMRFAQSPKGEGDRSMGKGGVGYGGKFNATVERSAASLTESVGNVIEKATSDETPIDVVQRQILRKDLVDLATGKFDPVKKDGWTQQALLGAAESIPLMVTASIPIVGPTALAAGYTSDFQNKAVREGSSLETASAMAPWVGGAQAALDMAQLKFLGKVPGLNALAGKIAAKPWLQAATKTVGTAVAETAVELTQDTLVEYAVKGIASQYRDDVKTQSFQKVMEEMADNVGPTFLAMLPWGALASGFGTARDFKAADTFSRNAEAMQLMGYKDSHIAEIQAAPRGEAVDLFTKYFADRTPITKGDAKGLSISESAGVVAEQLAQAAGTVISPMPETGDTAAGDSSGVQTSPEQLSDEPELGGESAAVPATIFRDANGWHVTREDGSTASVGTLENAHSLLKEMEMAQTDAEAQAYTEAIDWVSEAHTAKGLESEISTAGHAVTAQGGQVTSMSPQGKVQALEWGEADTKELANQMALLGIENADINGRNLVADGVHKIEINQSRQGVLTVLHEGVESIFKAGVAPEVTQAAAKAVSGAFQGSPVGESLSRIADGTATPTEARETMVELVVANEIGQRKDGSRIRPGTVTRGVREAIRRNAGAKSEKALVKFSNFLKSARAYMRALFGAAAKIKKARRDGVDLTDFDAFVDKVTGRDAQKNLDQASEKEAKESYSISPRYTPEQESAYKNAAEEGFIFEAQRILNEASGITLKDSTINRGGAHSPPSPEDGSPAWALDANGIYPSDVYSSDGLRYYGTGEESMDRQAYGEILRMKGHPNAKVKVYRAIEKDSKQRGINPGAWVTTVKAYAAEHGRSNISGEYRIQEKVVSAREIFTSGDSWLEWGYHPQPIFPKAIRKNEEGIVLPLRDRLNGNQYSATTNSNYIHIGHQKGLPAETVNGEEFPAVPGTDLYNVDLPGHPADGTTISLPEGSTPEQVQAAVERKVAEFDPKPGGATFSISPSGRQEGDFNRYVKDLFNEEIADVQPPSSASYFKGDPEVMNAAPVQRAFRVIDEVHSMGAAPVSDLRRETYRKASSYHPFTGTISLTDLRDNNRDVATLLHEVGHKMDLEVLQQLEGVDPKGWALYQRVEAAARETEESRKEGDDAYNNRPEEIYARAYAQYVAEKSSDEALQRYFRLDTDGNQWTTESFKPVREAFEALFRHLNLGKKANGASFSLSQSSIMDRLADEISAKIRRDPVKRGEVAKRQLENLATLKRNWSERRFTAMGDAINPVVEQRSSRELDNEQTFRMRSRQRELVATGMTEGKALKQAAKEARDWRAEADAMQKKDWSPRPVLLRFMSTLNTIMAPLPPEVRAKIGGFIALARLATPKAMEAEINSRIEKISTELERYLKREFTRDFQKLLDRSKPTKGKPGEKPMGKLGPDAHALFKAMEVSRGWDSDTVAGHIAGLQQAINSGELSAEDEARKQLEISLVELTGDWKNADAARMSAALDAAKIVYEGGYQEMQHKILERRERREAQRQALITDTGLSGTQEEKDARAGKDMAFFGRLKDRLLSISDWRQALEYTFGEKSETAAKMVDAERQAAYQKEDANQEVDDSVADLFKAIAGDAFAGEQLRYDLSQKTIEAGKAGTLSPMQVIQASLMWRQDDGKRHMEAFGYDQAWMDDVESKLSPEAKSVRDFLSSEYAAEYAPLNAVFRERNGVNLPSHANYAPLTVTPMQASAGQMVDPVTGGIVSGAGYTPGSLRSRSSIAKAQPDFRDALQTFIAHKRQLNHWIAYGDFVADANAVLGNRDVGNSIAAKGGEQALRVLRAWVDGFSQGGYRDASSQLAVSSFAQSLAGRAATIQLVGNIGTRLIQSTQIAAAINEMPTGAYIKRFGKLLAGQLSFKAALASPFIQRRIKQMSPVVRQAMEGLKSLEPTRLKHVVGELGKTINGADALFTAGTYAMIYDYQLSEGKKMGLEGAELDAYASLQAERGTERVAQPNRMGTRSILENTGTGAFKSLGWAYASEARQKIALAAWQLSKGFAPENIGQTARTAFLVWGIGGVMSQVIRNAWRDMRDDDDDEVFDEKNWSLKRLTLAALAGPLNGIPFVGDAIEAGMGKLFGVEQPSGGILDVDRSIGAAQRLVTGKSFKDDEPVETTVRDVNTVLAGLGFVSDSLAAASAVGTLVTDTIRVMDATHTDETEKAGQLKRAYERRKKDAREDAKDRAE